MRRGAVGAVAVVVVVLVVAVVAAVVGSDIRHGRAAAEKITHLTNA